MGINKFMIFLIIFTILFLLFDKEQLSQKEKKEKSPTVSFYDSTMYEITEENVNQIVKSKQADMYDDKEELKEATIVAKSDNHSYNTNIASSNKMIKIGDKVFLNEKVNLQLSDGTNIKTEQLNYNLKTKIANNSVAFIVLRDNDTFQGENLFLDSIAEHITADKAKFKMKVGNNE